MSNYVPAMSDDFADFVLGLKGNFDALNDFGKPMNNAGFRNSIYRGKFLGTTVTPAQYANIANGTFKDMYIGDHWIVNGRTYIIAAFNYYLRCGDADLTANHVTLVPAGNFYTHVMNATSATTGGYIGSLMYTEGLAQAKSIIKGDFTRVLKHRQIFSNATSDGKASGWAWVDSEVDLMGEIMVYGSVVWGESTIGGTGHNIGLGKSQLPLFLFRPDLIGARIHWWLRDVAAASSFAYVTTSGIAAANYAGTALGVRPAFSIS